MRYLNPRSGIIAVVLALSVIAFQNCSPNFTTISGVATGNVAPLNLPSPNPGSGARTEALLSWAAPDGGQQLSYSLEQSSDGTNFKAIQSLGASATSASVEGLTPGKTYYFRIKSSNTVGDSSYSQVMSVALPSS